MTKKKLYKVDRYYSAPAIVYVLSGDKEEANTLVEKKYGKAETKIKRIKQDKSKILLY